MVQRCRAQIPEGINDFSRPCRPAQREQLAQIVGGVQPLGFRGKRPGRDDETTRTETARKATTQTMAMAGPAQTKNLQSPS